jgi:hypothetical protein
VWVRRASTFRDDDEQVTGLDEGPATAVHLGTQHARAWQESCSSLNSTLRTILARLHVSDTDGFPSRGILSVIAIFHQLTCRCVPNFLSFIDLPHSWS